MPNILVLGTADWNQPIATNQHYMTRELARDFPTTFVESLGLRSPEISIRDLRRLVARVWSTSSSDVDDRRPIPSGVEVVSPIIVPFHKRPFLGLNRRLLVGGRIRAWAQSDAPKLFWTYSPVTYGLEEFADAAVYHCVDLLGEFPGIDRVMIDRHERRLAAAGVRAAASSAVVRDHLVSQGFDDPIYWPNVADAEMIIDSASNMGVSRSSSAVFAGNLTAKKVDFLLLKQLLSAGVDLHLAGPVAQGGGEAEGLLQELVAMGANYHGMLPIASLSKLMARCTVGLIPYEINAYTRGVSPLKVYEYLAAGLYVVSSPVPSVSPTEGHVDVQASHEAFVSSVLKGLSSAEESVLSERAQLARDHSWSGRGEEARTLVASMIGSGRPNLPTSKSHTPTPPVSS